MALIRVVFRILPTEYSTLEVAYDDSHIVAGHTLGDFRARADPVQLRSLLDQALFENPENRMGREPIHPDDEHAILLSDAIDTNTDDRTIFGAKVRTLVLWSAKYASAMASGGFIEIGKGIEPDRAGWIPANLVGNKLLNSLRSALIEAGHMSADDRFLDQGVPIAEEREPFVPAIEILTPGRDPPELHIADKRDVDALLLDMHWREGLPILDIPGSRPDGLGPGFARDMTGLTPAEQAQVMQNCGLYPMPHRPETSAALRFGASDIEFAPTRTLLCRKVTVLASQLAREDRVSVGYGREQRQWQSSLVNVSHLDVHLPMVFGLKTKRTGTTDTESLANGETIHLTKILALPKAEVLLEEVSLSPTYLDKVRRILAQNDAAALVDLLANDGLFVATQFILGAMIIGQSTTVLQGKTNRDALTSSYDISVSGLFAKHSQHHSGSTTVRANDGRTYNVNVRTIGGSGEAIGTTPGSDTGEAWLHSVATKPQMWRVIGYKADDIKPVLDYFPADLRENAKTLLRNYFERLLALRKSPAYGGGGGRDWNEQHLARLDNKVDSCTIMFDQNIDSIRFSYRDRKTGARQAGEWRGASREKEHPFILGAGDEIVAIEVGWDNTVDHILIHTRNDDNTGSVMGRAKGAKHTHIFQEPRIRGFHGRADHFLDALGVYYYDLPNTLPQAHRSVLLSLERYLRSG